MASMGVIDPSLDLPKPMLDVAVTGSRTLGLAARLGDGISISVGASLEALAMSVDTARGAWRDAGRVEADLSINCFVQVAITDDRDESAREAIRGLVITHAGFSRGSTRERGPGEPADERPRSRIPREAEAQGATSGGEINFYPEGDDDGLIDQFAIVGSPDDCAQRLEAIAALGFARIYIGTRAVGVDLEEGNTRNVGLQVLSQLH